MVLSKSDKGQDENSGVLQITVPAIQWGSTQPTPNYKTTSTRTGTMAVWLSTIFPAFIHNGAGHTAGI